MTQTPPAIRGRFLTDLPPDLAAFASLLDGQPGPVRAAFAYCLALEMVQDGKARLVERDIQWRPYNTTESVL